jgi:translation elongation factor EF-1alpha
MAWYKGPCLLDLISSLDESTLLANSAQKALRLKVSAYRKVGGVGTVAIGKIFSGKLKAGD